MPRLALWLSPVVFAGLFLSARAEEPATLMCDRGQLLFSDDFTAPPAKPWNVGKGKWDVAEGVLTAAELPADMHGAVMRAALKQRNVVIQYSFRLNGAKGTSLSINDPQGHNSRVNITSAGFGIRKDDHDHEGPDKAVNLQNVKLPLKEGDWHTLVVEFNGPEMLARVDGNEVAYGTHEAIDVDKTNFGLTVSGESVSFKNLRVWAATPKADWASTREKFKTAAK